MCGGIEMLQKVKLTKAQANAIEELLKVRKNFNHNDNISALICEKVDREVNKQPFNLPKFKAANEISIPTFTMALTVGYKVIETLADKANEINDKNIADGNEKDWDRGYNLGFREGVRFIVREQGLDEIDFNNLG
jgi:hypothetical protein